MFVVFESDFPLDSIGRAIPSTEDHYVGPQDTLFHLPNHHAVKEWQKS
jgi:hypothetical protein